MHKMPNVDFSEGIARGYWVKIHAQRISSNYNDKKLENSVCGINKKLFETTVVFVLKLFHVKMVISKKSW